MNLCIWCKTKPARKKFCSPDCGLKFHNAKRLVSLGWIKHKPSQKYFCKWCQSELSGQQRKFCCQNHALKWQAKFKPEQLRAAARKYQKKNRKAIHQRKLVRHWNRMAGVNSFEEFKKLELAKEKLCATCKKIFHSEWRNEKYCSRLCSGRAAYKRQKDSGAIKFYQSTNRKKINQHQYEYIRGLPKSHNYKIRMAISGRILSALKRKNLEKSKSTIQLLGCTIPQLKVHLESKFTPGMSWENHTFYGWHIDHIRPCASFDLTKPSEQRKCFNYKNLQPLWRDENMAKGDNWTP